MKYPSLFIFLSTALICILLSACHHNHNQPPQVNSKVLSGTWEYRNRTGGNAPITPGEFAPGMEADGLLPTINFRIFIATVFTEAARIPLPILA